MQKPRNLRGFRRANRVREETFFSVFIFVFKKARVFCGFRKGVWAQAGTFFNIKVSKRWEILNWLFCRKGLCPEKGTGLRRTSPLRKNLFRHAT